MSKAFSHLEALLTKNEYSHTRLAEALGITPQAIQSWKSLDHIPPKRVSQIVDAFALKSTDVDILLGNDPLEICFRTKNGEEITQERVPEEVSVRAETLFERFFHIDETPKTYDLTNLRTKIASVKDSFMQIADAIRIEFTIPKFKPLDMSGLSTIYDRVRIPAFFLPFKSIDLIGSEEFAQTAILFKKGNYFVILLDSDRNIDEAHFDQLHELIHIFFEGIDFGLDQNSYETLIDKVCGELIYPKEYIVERFFDNDPTSKPITNPDLLRKKFLEDADNYTYAISPKGLGRSMRDTGLATDQTQLYKYLTTQLHDEYRKEAVNYSKLGRMNRDFSNPKAMLEFYKLVEDKAKKTRYPLFEKIKKDVLDDVLGVSDFADTFLMDAADAMYVKAIWEKETQKVE